MSKYVYDMKEPILNFNSIAINAAPYLSQCSSGTVHLVGGVTSSEGRFEVCIGGTWTTLSGYPSSWDTPNAEVLCRQLGLPSLGTVSSCLLFLHIND